MNVFISRSRHGKCSTRIAEIKDMSDYQVNWNRLVKPLRRGQYHIVEPESLAIHGDAPKCFVYIREYVRGKQTRKLSTWPGYIAKVGSKFYPIESITEHAITRVGQMCHASIADSQLRVVGRQVRFLSKYFLNRKREQLVHGLEIFKRHLDEEMVEEIAAKRWEAEFYTFQTVIEAMRDCYPEHWQSLMDDFVELLAFDALVGNNDRHPMNWGVIVPVTSKGRPRFSPIFDTARGLFWRSPETDLRKMEADNQKFASYLNQSRPQIGWDGRSRLDHFQLIGAICAEYPEYRDRIHKMADECPIDDCVGAIKKEFQGLMSDVRIRMIERCLRARHERLCVAAKGKGGHA